MTTSVLTLRGNSNKFKAVIADTKDFYKKMIDQTKKNGVEMAFNQGQAVQAAKNHLFLDTLNYANRLSLSEHWSKITTPAPVGLYHLHGKLFAVSAKNTFKKLDLEDSVDLMMQPDAVVGFKKVAGLDTEKNPINAACYLYGGQPGISLSKDDRQEEEEGELKEVIILGGAFG